MMAMMALAAAPAALSSPNCLCRTINSWAWWSLKVRPTSRAMQAVAAATQHCYYRPAVGWCQATCWW